MLRAVLLLMIEIRAVSVVRIGRVRMGRMPMLVWMVVVTIGLHSPLAEVDHFRTHGAERGVEQRCEDDPAIREANHASMVSLEPWPNNGLSRTTD